MVYTRLRHPTNNPDKKKRQKFGEYARTTSLNYSSDVVTKEWIALLKRKA